MRHNPPNTFDFGINATGYYFFFKPLKNYFTSALGVSGPISHEISCLSQSHFSLVPLET
jgi:hypothetical protein